MYIIPAFLMRRPVVAAWGFPSWRAPAERRTAVRIPVYLVFGGSVAPVLFAPRSLLPLGRGGFVNTEGHEAVAKRPVCSAGIGPLELTPH